MPFWKLRERARLRKGAQTGAWGMAHIGVELPNKGGEVVVLEVLGQQLLGTLRLIPDSEAAEQTG